MTEWGPEEADLHFDKLFIVYKALRKNTLKILKINSSNSVV